MMAMTRAARTGFLGGIGLMLEVAHICPRCGKQLSENPSAAAQHISKDRCRPAVFAALPEPERAGEDDDVPPVPAARQIHDFETPAPKPRRASLPVTMGVVDPVPAGNGLPRGLAIPWLHPPDLGEVL
jgi:hypothetical protein